PSSAWTRSWKPSSSSWSSCNWPCHARWNSTPIWYRSASPAAMPWLICSSNATGRTRACNRRSPTWTRPVNTSSTPAISSGTSAGPEPISANARRTRTGKPPVLLEERDHTYQLFQPEADDLAEMWSDHPTNFERELNAKACYIRTDFDETSPWPLFGDLESLRRKVSAQFYRQVFRVKQDSVTWSSPSKVQEFLDDERAESTF